MIPLFALCWGTLLVGRAQAEDRLSWRLWSWSRAEALPDLAGESQLRASQTVRLDLRLDGGWQFDAMAGVRDPTMPEPVEPDLYRLSLRHRSAWYGLAAGRIVRLGSRGAMRLDGLSLDLGSDRRLGLGLWGGRLWHPETWEVGQSDVFGAELRGQPLRSGALDLGLGYEARLEQEAGAEEEDPAEQVLGHRVFGNASLRSVQGARVALLAELDPASGDGELPDSRASLRLGTPLGRHVDLSATGRWEDLPAAIAPAALTEPTQWLAGTGYGAVEGEARLRLGPAMFQASGGPTWFAGAEAGGDGGRGRLGVEVELAEPLRVGLAGIGATVDASWIRGGVVEASVEAGTLRLGADAGLFRFQPIAGPLAGVWEARVLAEGGLPLHGTPVQELALQGWLATGSDRVLEPWLRGGLSLVGRLGDMPEEMP